MEMAVIALKLRLTSAIPLWTLNVAFFLDGGFERLITFERFKDSLPS